MSCFGRVKRSRAPHLAVLYQLPKHPLASPFSAILLHFRHASAMRLSFHRLLVPYSIHRDPSIAHSVSLYPLELTLVRTDPRPTH